MVILIQALFDAPPGGNVYIPTNWIFIAALFVLAIVVAYKTRSRL